MAQFVVLVADAAGSVARLHLTRDPDRWVAELNAECPWDIVEVTRVAGNWRTLRLAQTRFSEVGSVHKAQWWQIESAAARAALEEATGVKLVGQPAAARVEVVARVDTSKFDADILAGEVQILANMHRLGKPCGIVVTERHRELAEAMGVDIG